MPLPKVSFSALTPRPHEPIIQPCSQGGADQWNHSSRPFLHDLSAGPRGYTPDHPWNELVHHFLLQQISADVHSRGAGGCNPQFSDLAVRAELEAVHEAQFLYSAHGDPGKNPAVGNDAEQSPHPDACALPRPQLHTPANNPVPYAV